MERVLEAADLRVVHIDVDLFLFLLLLLLPFTVAFSSMLVVLI
jgi:hypothetical protein